MACTERLRRPQDHGRPSKSDPVGQPPVTVLNIVSKAFRCLASSALKRHIAKMPKSCLAALIISICLSVPAQAQDAPAPFDNDLQRLAEILGTLHYLRGICGSNEGGKWRNEMQALVDAETPSGERRARMIAAFNRGYNGFQQTYRSCTPAAAVAIRRYIEEGSKISRDLTARYAN